MGIIRILLISDTHLGFDLPFRPRIQRRRRGPELFANFQRALTPALRAEVDGVVHCGDLLYRSKVPPRLVDMAFEPLKQVAAGGIPVYLVPGNHERSAIPHDHLASHPHIHLFDRPRSYRLDTDRGSLVLAGFPFVRSNVRRNFPRIVDQTGWRQVKADAGVLCIHQSVDGATVGPGGYIFRFAQDVVRTTDIPAGLAAVLAGHIHRFQVLTKDLKGRQLTAPVYYPGSIERISFAEKKEPKGYVILEIATRGTAPGTVAKSSFHPLPVRPMIQLHLDAAGLNRPQIVSWIRSRLTKIPEDSVLQLKVHGQVSEDALQAFRASSLRALAPAAMNISATLREFRRYRNQSPKSPG